jgi:uncharacterized protein YlxW (UPF0749 family)
MTERPERGHTVLRARPDASMLLLNNLMHNTLDEGYAEAAQRRATAGDGARPHRPGALAGVALVVLALLLATAYGQVQRSETAATQARNDLIQRIDTRTAQTDRLREELAKLRKQVNSAQDRALQATATGGQASRSLSRLELAAGVAPAAGPGIVVTVDDAAGDRTGSGDPRDRTGPDLARVLDSDLQRLVNGLWAAGAEAVEINGQRLTALSAIRSAGDAILVDFRPLSPPYTVKAIGDPKTLDARFADSSAGRQFSTLQQTYGIRFDVATKKKLRLPGASTVSLHLAREKKPAAGSSGAPVKEGAP